MTRRLGLTTEDIAAARSFLFVPGDRPERFDRAAASGADIVVVDLEDAVLPASKASALDNAVGWLTAGNPALVRINAVSSPFHSSEMQLLAGTAAAVMLPKAEHPDHVAQVVAAMGAAVRVVPLVETALGVESVHALCSHPGVVRVAFGHVDLAAQLGVDHRSTEAFGYGRSRLVYGSAAAGIAGPIDGVTTDLADERSLDADLHLARALGMTGKLCIHPRQVGPVNRALSPGDKELEWAARVLAAPNDHGVATIEGEMVDAPVLARARAILARANRNRARRK